MPEYTHFTPTVQRKNLLAVPAVTSTKRTAKPLGGGPDSIPTSNWCELLCSTPV